MNRQKLRWAISLFVCVMFFALHAQAENLLVNADFEELDANGLPAQWEISAYTLEDSEFTVSKDAYSGESAVQIQSESGNDARFWQTVEVEPGSLYCLSGYIKADYLPDVGAGANLSVEGVFYEVDGLFDTKGEWVQFVDYGETGEDQTSVTIYARLGGYSRESSGLAMFDNLSLTKVDALPEDVVAKLWYQSGAALDNSAQFMQDAAESFFVRHGPFTIWLVLFALGFAALVIFLFPYLKKDENVLVLGESKSPLLVFGVGLCLSMLLRGVMAYFVPGHEVDMDCFIAWGNGMVQYGPSGFYEGLSFCDYVPGYLYVLWVNGLLYTSNRMMNIFIIKLVPMLCDAVTAMVLYREGKKELGGKAAAVLGLLYAFNPAIILNSAAWGQIDSVYTLLLLLVVIYGMRRSWHLAIPFFFLAVLVKPQALMFGPLGLAALVMDIVKNKPDPRKYIAGLGIGALLAVIAIVPFSGGQPSDWLIERYTGTIGSYPYSTVNAANFYYLLDKNWQPLTERVPLYVVAAFAVCGVGFGLYQMIRRRRGAALYGALGCAAIALAAGVFTVLKPEMMTFNLFGTVMIVLIVGATLYQFIVGGEMRHLPLAGGMMMLLMYVFGTMMHERYLFPALILFALAYAIEKDWRILVLMAVASGTMFVNCGIILDNTIRLGRASGHLNLDTQGLSYTVAVINMAAAVLALYTGRDLMTLRKEPMRIKWQSPFNEKGAYRTVVSAAQEALLRPKGHRLHMRGRDYIIMLGVTALYAVLTLVNLGSTKAPQTYYATLSAEDEIVFDLGAEKTVRMLYYAQVSYNHFGVAVSDDGDHWSEEYPAQMAQGECFRWKYLTGSYPDVNDKLAFNASDRLELTGRYVKILPKQANLKLCEVMFRDLDGNLVKAAPVTDSAMLLLDEQDTLDGEPSWFNSTYFDEIYHARTAYEHAHAFDQDAIDAGVFPYETTHPPLGKVIMSWFIMLFGMTPFAWRFAGALMGILMLPAMYLLGKQLFGKTSFACSAMLLMALDCMHLTQTRIATIDSFAVLFIIMAYFFMLRYMKMDVWGVGLWRSFVPLLLSGAFMGLSIASKWIGIYAGMGLALLFLYSVIQHLRQWRAAQKFGMVDGERQKAVARAHYYGLSDALIRCALCVVFFIVIPLAIYYASYIPYFNTTGGVTVERVIEAAIGTDHGSGVRIGGMLGYHATPGLGMDHPFYSPWYEWPLILKPMYYAADNYLPAGWAYSIFLMGNPAVWWAGLAALFVAAFIWLKRHVYNAGPGLSLHASAYDADIAWGFMLIGFLSQYLPWVLVPRGTYIYHYFASVPFIILCIVAVFKRLEKRLGKKVMTALWVYVAVCAVCFAILYPYASGVTVQTGWLDFARNLMIKRNIYY